MNSVTSPDSDAVLLRQRERTTDNVKWLIAYVFAFSFATAGTNVFKDLEPFFQGKPLSGAWQFPWIDLEILAAFTITASVFYYQGARRLDLRYAKSKDYIPHPLAFVFDVATIALTMVPFVLMANALGPTIVKSVGLLGFFYAYILLLGFGLLILLIGDIRHSKWFAARLAPGEVVGDDGREDGLRLYWLIMNSTILLILAVLFWCFSRSGNCATSVGQSVPTFLVIFGAVAILRDCMDFFYAWPFIFPLRELNFKAPVTWIIADCDKHGGKRSRLLGYGILSIALAVGLLANNWLNYRFWAEACTIVASPAATAPGATMLNTCILVPESCGSMFSGLQHGSKAPGLSTQEEFGYANRVARG